VVGHQVAGGRGDEGMAAPVQIELQGALGGNDGAGACRGARHQTGAAATAAASAGASWPSIAIEPKTKVGPGSTVMRTGATAPSRATVSVTLMFSSGRPAISMWMVPP
jgi:hypothetical protein